MFGAKVHPFPGNVLRRVAALDGDYESPEARKVVDNLEDANVVTSEVVGKPDTHRPVLDLDVGATLLPSSTPGHAHLYLDVEMCAERYAALLDALADAGVIERGFATASVKRGHSAVRLPWIRKAV